VISRHVWNCCAVCWRYSGAGSRWRRRRKCGRWVHTPRDSVAPGLGMSILGAVVQIPVLAMFDARQDLLCGCAIAPECIRDHDLRPFKSLRKNCFAARWPRRRGTRILSPWPS
jgi:hypothetical protein